MSRQPRLFSESGVYHIMLRGVNHCHLFEEIEDFEYFLARLALVKTELSLGVFAYCLMSNHVHLLVREESPGDVVALMRKSLTPYAWWFNRKYARSGALIANRYKSACVTDDAYLLSVVRYIHRNPVEAGMTAQMEGYLWSSYRSYVTGVSALVDTDFVLGMFGSDRATAVTRFAEFHRDDSSDLVVDLCQGVRRDEAQIRVELAAKYGGLVPSAVDGLPRADRDGVVAYLRGRGFSVRQIERVTGVPRGIVARIHAANQEM